MGCPSASRRSGEPGASRCCCPTISSRLRGLSRTASGACGLLASLSEPPRCGGSGSRFPNRSTDTRPLYPRWPCSLAEVEAGALDPGPPRLLVDAPCVNVCHEVPAEVVATDPEDGDPGGVVVALVRADVGVALAEGQFDAGLRLLVGERREVVEAECGDLLTLTVALLFDALALERQVAPVRRAVAEFGDAADRGVLGLRLERAQMVRGEACGLRKLDLLDRLGRAGGEREG